MHYKTLIAILASTLTMIGCVTSEPTTYGIKDHQWQAMSHKERQIAKKEYAKRPLDADNMAAAQGQDYAPKNSLILYPSKEQAEKTEIKEQAEMQEHISAIAQNADIDKTIDNQKIDSHATEANKTFTREDAANLAQSDTDAAKVALSSSLSKTHDISEEYLVRANELIVNLQSKLGRQPLLGEMQHELQSNMGISSRQARRIIDALGLY
jgi:hypothetical protein